MINRYGANVSPCSTPATILKSSVFPSGERTFTFVFLYCSIMAATVFFLVGGVGEKYLLYLFFVYGVKGLGEVDK